MPGVEDMIRMAEMDLGLAGRPNRITRWYSNRNGGIFSSGPWCDMAITYWASLSDNYGTVCFGTDFAYTVWHAQKFQQMGAWHTDVAGIRRGDIVFFDWSGTNGIPYVDHVGVVTAVVGADVHTIEGNTDDKCLRRVRRANTIAGYGRPNYAQAPVATVPIATKLQRFELFPQIAALGTKDSYVTGKFPDRGAPVQTVQNAMNIILGWEAKGKYKLTPDGDYGNKTFNVVIYYQSVNFGVASGFVGPQTWAAIDSDLRSMGR